MVLSIVGTGEYFQCPQNSELSVNTVSLKINLQHRSDDNVIKVHGQQYLNIFCGDAELQVTHLNLLQFSKIFVVITGLLNNN